MLGASPVTSKATSLESFRSAREQLRRARNPARRTMQTQSTATGMPESSSVSLLPSRSWRRSSQPHEQDGAQQQQGPNKDARIDPSHEDNLAPIWMTAGSSLRNMHTGADDGQMPPCSMVALALLSFRGPAAGPRTAILSSSATNSESSEAGRPGQLRAVTIFSSSSTSSGSSDAGRLTRRIDSRSSSATSSGSSEPGRLELGAEGGNEQKG
mmetsp:Transcript_32331/g.64495  ORF Transcript_32331/g.64495 Transcript_32331/m.64495 type:complete len:212 (-) Transcript_32331:440-1075(-)